MKKQEIALSPLGHTWFIDVDGTIVKHNGYLLDDHDTLLPGVKEFFASIPAGDKIILVSSRKPAYREPTLAFLKDNGIRFDDAIFDLPYGERIIINDKKKTGLVTSFAISPKRDEGLNSLLISIDEQK
jgi:hypothetical protein